MTLYFCLCKDEDNKDNLLVSDNKEDIKERRKEVLKNCKECAEIGTFPFNVIELVGDINYFESNT